VTKNLDLNLLPWERWRSPEGVRSVAQPTSSPSEEKNFNPLAHVSKSASVSDLFGISLFGATTQNEVIHLKRLTSMNINFVGFAILCVALKASDAFWGVVFTHMWEWLFAQIDWRSLTRKLKLNLLVLYLDWLVRQF
jgi:hypothetical protein